MDEYSWSKIELKLISPYYLSVRVQVKTVHRRRAVEVGRRVALPALCGNLVSR